MNPDLEFVDEAYAFRVLLSEETPTPQQIEFFYRDLFRLFRSCRTKAAKTKISIIMLDFAMSIDNSYILEHLFFKNELATAASRWVSESGGNSELEDLRYAFVKKCADCMCP